MFNRIHRKFFMTGREAIEKLMLPKVKNKEVLWVGVSEYTKHYPLLLSGNDLVTLDINPHVREFGAKNHIVGDIKTIKIKKKFDIIFLLGIIGYEIDIKEQSEQTLRNCYNLLKKDGILVISTTQKRYHNQINPRKLSNYGLFQPIECFGFSSPTLIRGQLFEFLLKINKVQL